MLTNIFIVILYIQIKGIFNRVTNRSFERRQAVHGEASPKWWRLGE